MTINILFPGLLCINAELVNLIEVLLSLTGNYVTVITIQIFFISPRNLRRQMYFSLAILRSENCRNVLDKNSAIFSSFKNNVFLEQNNFFVFEELP